MNEEHNVNKRLIATYSVQSTSPPSLPASADAVQSACGGGAKFALVTLASARAGLSADCC